MHPQNHFKRPPAQPYAQGYRPEPEPVSFGQVMLAIVITMLAIAAGVGITLPLVSHLVRWVLGGP
jgi:hypothetical protein